MGDTACSEKILSTPGGVFRRLRLPLGAARGQDCLHFGGRFFLAVHTDDRKHARGDIDADKVALLDQRDRAAAGRLGRNVADGRAGGRAGEASVRDQGDRATSSLSDEIASEV